jgi:lipopolysaccharide core galacturonosyltransferase RgtB
MSKNSTSSTSRSRLENPATFLGLAAGYFLFQTILRSFISPVADLDESEQLIFTQSFQWGYSAHPPLYTWLQMAVFKVFGPSILGLAVLKNMLLFGCYALIFGAAWRITRNVLAATVTGLSLIFIPQISWESQRDLTHSVLASALTAATVLSFFKAHESKHLRHYALLGLCFGLGMLSNYNYAVIALAMLAAAALMREFRPVILHPFMLLAVLVGLGLAAPHFLWAMDHSSVALGSVSELHRQPRTWHANAAWSALKLLSAWFSHIAAFAAAMLLLCWREWTPWRNWLVPAASRFIAATLGIFLLFAYVALLLSEATAMRGRWLQPAYVLLPLFAGAILGQRVQAATARRVVIAAGVVAVSISVAL